MGVEAPVTILPGQAACQFGDLPAAPACLLVVHGEQPAACPVRQVSVETAQSNLDCSVLRSLPEKTIILGVLDLSTPEVESAETVAARIRRALPFVSAERMIVAPDCGLKYLSRETAFAKMQALVAGARLVREELSGGSRPARAAGA